MKKMFAPVVLAGLLVLPALAQLDTGIIEGTVRDASGAAVPNAPVTITETQTNISYNVTSSGQGNYVSPPLKVGIYSVSASAPGFKTYTRAGITLQVQDRLSIDVRLEVGAKNEQVVVTGEAPLIQSDTSSLGQVITAQQIVDMPLNGRSYSSLATLTTGVIATSGSATNGNTAGGFSANGVRGDLNNFVLDGIDNNNNSGGGGNLGVNLDAIAEFKVQTSSYDAEFGRAGGAALNVVIKSGTNQIHGSAFEFFQNAYLNAQSFFATTKALSTKYNEPGATIGFPIIKNRFFFFGDYQGTFTSTPAVDKSSVPTAAEKQGDFSKASAAAAGIPALKTLYDPFTTNAAGTSRTPYPNNVIPASEFSPLGYNVAQLYPLPNVPNTAKNNFLREPTSTGQSSQGDGRGDYRISDADSMFARFTQSGSLGFTAPKMGGLACGCGSSTYNNPGHGLGSSVGETHIFTPTTLNEFRVGFSWDFFQNGLTQGGFLPPPPGLQTPGVVNNSALQGISYFSPSTFSGLGQGNYAPTWGNGEERQIRDTLNLVRGRHTIRIGGEMRWSEFDLMQLSYPRGDFQFTGQYTGAPGSTGNGLADMLVGIPFYAAIDPYTYLGNREKIPAFFISDDFKVSRKLTLNLGLRYEFYSPIHDDHNAQSNFDYATGQLLVAGMNGNSESLATAQHLNFGPRVGFAYNPIQNFVVRSGFGIFYSGQEVRTGDPLQIQYNLPFYYQPTLQGNGISPSSGTTLAQGFPSPIPPGCAPQPLTSTCQAVFPGVTSLDTNVKTPYYLEWNIAIQRQLPGHIALEASYVGSKGLHLQSVTDPNQDRNAEPGDVDIQGTRPYPFFSGFTAIQMRGNAHFNSFQLKVDKHLANGLYFLSAFTFSKAIDDTVPICCNEIWPDNSYNLKAEKSLADYNQTFRWVTSFDYQLPFGKGMHWMNQNKALDLILGGWHGSGIFTMTTGFYETPQMGYDSSNTGTQGFTLPDRLMNNIGVPSGQQRSISNWFNANAFADAADGTFGNSGYNILEGPGLINLDLGIRKIFNITERQKLEFRAEMFNTFNHPNFGLPDANIDDGPGATGVITGLAAKNRVIQFALKYRF